MAHFRQARDAVVARILGGDGRASTTDRRAAFENTQLPEPLGVLIHKVAEHAYQITDEDIAAVRKAGLSEDQVFELVVCAAIGHATRQSDSALVALEAASRKE